MATSDEYVYSNSNPYIDIYDRLAASPNARANDQTPIYNEALSLIEVAVQQVYLMQQTPIEALTEAQREIDKRLASQDELAAARAAWSSR